MANAISGVVGAKSISNTQPVGDQDFAQIRPLKIKPVKVKSIQNESAQFKSVDAKTQDKGLPTSEKSEEKKSLFTPDIEVSEETVSQVADAFNDLMNKINCDLKLSYNKEANMINVKVLDKEGNIIREYPSDEMMKHFAEAEEKAEDNQPRGLLVNQTI
jgi:uncharacterized FlaG/YvyC family protein